jgi:hypothetical protein
MRPLASPFSVLLIASLGLRNAHAQVQVRIGPTAGLNLATAPYERNRSYRTTYTTGLAAGAVASVSRGHFALQPALLFSQKGFGIDDDYTEQSAGQTTIVVTTSTYRLNYLALPLNLAYAQHDDGQGLQVFAGAYAALLLGGEYSAATSYSVSTPRSATGGITKASAKVAGGDYFPTTPGDDTYYSRRYDFGVQGGLGYRYGPALVQLGYSLGLRDLGADYKFGNGAAATIAPGPSYQNRAFQLSVAYLFSPAK